MSEQGWFFRIFVTGYIRKLRYISLFFILFFSLFSAFAQPANDSWEKAIPLTEPTKCSADAAYSNINATDEGAVGTGPQWPAGETGRDVWFKFTAIAFDITITVTGNSTGGGSSGGTLRDPLIAMYTIENSGITTNYSSLIGSLAAGSSISTYNKGGLTVGKEYYIRVSAKSNATGTFRICLNNYFAPLKAGQDFNTASILCNKQSFSELKLEGAGLNNRETAGSCLGQESNSVWYKWTAATSGTLTMNIIPMVNTDDIDWVLYDLGPTGNFNNKILLRCAAGHGVDNDGCRNEPLYFRTGMNMTSTDLTEAGGCGSGQDGYLRYIDMVQGRTYALVIDRFTAGNTNGFKLEFGGTGEFVGPEAKIVLTKNQPCSANQSFSFNNTGSKNFTRVEWNFGEGASIPTANTPGPHTVTYSSPGFKTAVLQVFNDIGCAVSITESFFVGIKPAVPQISGLKPSYCIGETIELSTTAQTDVIYSWTGPNNFSSNLQSPEIPVTSEAVAGTYSLTLSRGNCSTETVNIVVPPIYKTPVAAFRSEPKPPAKLSFPVRIRFFSESRDADAFLWNFGDGNTSTDRDPEHTYRTDGNFDVSLTVFKSSVCSASTTQGQFMISANNILFIPNTFTPNNDALNDEFVISMTNIRTYRIQIFNRFGVPMFVSEDLFNHWNGNFRNEPSPVGTYYYLIDASDFNGNIIKKTGSVTILR